MRITCCAVILGAQGDLDIYHAVIADIPGNDDLPSVGVAQIIVAVN